VEGGSTYPGGWDSGMERCVNVMSVASMLRGLNSAFSIGRRSKSFHGFETAIDRQGDFSYMRSVTSGHSEGLAMNRETDAHACVAH
jgi:hypothetical protein